MTGRIWLLNMTTILVTEASRELLLVVDRTRSLLTYTFAGNGTGTADMELMASVLPLSYHFHPRVGCPFCHSSLLPA